MKILKCILWIMLFFYIVIIFLPKENFYFLLEQKLNGHGVIFDNETLDDFGGVLSIKDSRIIYDNEEVGRIDKIAILPFILYNKIDISGLHILANNLKGHVPEKIDEASFKITPFYPTKVWINLKGNFGYIHGSYNIYDKTIRLVLQPQDNFKQMYPFIYANFKNVEGELVYESTFK
ncbi:MAG: hypothetical protein LBT96_04660 [Campylobacteraceae bacterium]|jgi:hypothetical protein|nr:hypothetical protein [Campylobacteraceae bacterium]